MQGGTVFSRRTTMYMRFSLLKQRETIWFMLIQGHVPVGPGNNPGFHARMLLLSASIVGMTLRPTPNISFALTFIGQHMQTKFSLPMSTLQICLQYTLSKATMTATTMSTAELAIGRS